MKIYVAIPGIEGSSTASGFVGQIECQGMTQQVEAVKIDDRTAPKKTYGPMTLTKRWDKTSIALANTLVTNGTLSSVTITCVSLAGVRHMTIKLTNAKVQAIQQAGSQGGASALTEQVQLTFGTIEITYSPEGNALKPVSDTTAPQK
jgi:type VI secretion system Hcp family effector